MNIDINFFYEDAADQLRDLERILQDIKNGTDNQEKIGDLFRAFHTLKGAAGMFELNDIVVLTHKAEDLLDKVRDKKVSFDSSLASLFIEVKDMIETLVDNLSQNKEISNNINETILQLEKKLIKNMKTNIVQKTPKKIFQKKSIKDIVQKEKIKTILIVDDASMIRNLASKTAQVAGYNVVTAVDGFDGLEKLKHNDFDLIFSDVNMPQMGGLEMVQKIRENQQYQFLPIVMLTTEKKEELKKQGKNLGVKAWLVKPFNKKKLLTVLEKLLG